jgi:hypothetical protein
VNKLDRDYQDALRQAIQASATLKHHNLLCDIAFWLAEDTAYTKDDAVRDILRVCKSMRRDAIEEE